MGASKSCGSYRVCGERGMVGTIESGYWDLRGETLEWALLPGNFARGAPTITGGAGSTAQQREQKMSAMQAGSLAIVISKETWTRKRKYDIQREDSPLCLVCQGTEGEADDTILHRKFGCQGIQKWKGITI